MGKDAKWMHKTVNEYFYSPKKKSAGDAFGIEIELEGVTGQMPFVDGWQAVADGSLRDGIEYISDGPKTYGEVHKGLDDLAAAFAAINFTPVFSYRTSLHVHVNALDMTWIELANMFTLYTIFEAPILDFGGEERVGNVHCLPVSLATSVIDNLAGMFGDDAGDSNAYMRALYHRDRRYASFNWASLCDKGTVEFRSHRGTMDKETVLSWVRLLQILKDKAKEFHDPAQIVQDFSAQGLQGFSQRIFGMHDAFRATIPNFERYIWEGLRLAQHVAYSRSVWPDKPAKKKQKDVMLEEAVHDEFVIVDEAPRTNEIRWADLRPLQGIRPGDIWAPRVPAPPQPPADREQEDARALRARNEYLAALARAAARGARNRP